MPFLVYLFALVIGVTGVLLEVNWLTRPKYEPQPVAQVVAQAATVAPKPKADGPSVALSPIYPTNPNGVAPAEPAAAAPQVATQTPAPDVKSQAATPQAMQQVETPKVVTAAAAAPAPAAMAAATPVAATAAPNHCDIPACASAYRSFRASDCSYQPFDGPRKLCELPAGAGQKIASEPRASQPAARPRSQDAELRDAVRKVKEITNRDDVDYGVSDADIDGSESGVIVTGGPRREWRRW